MKILPILLILISSNVFATQKMVCSIKSPTNKIALIEMYTSEACSSCPPGDRAISVLPTIIFLQIRLLF